jgi:hypothetical protein
MPSSLAFKPSRQAAPARHPAYRTLQGWALGTLIEQGAVVECPHHGHRVDRADPDAWTRAREEAWRNPFAGATPEICIAALEGLRFGPAPPILTYLVQVEF